MKRFGLIGKTLKHSFSRDYFTRKFQQEGITDCSYELFPLEQIADLPVLLSGHDDWVGLNVTIPYKTDVLRYATNLSHLPQGLHAANCLHFYQKEIIAHNTDVVGFEKSFLPSVNKQYHKAALVLGSGGAAQAVQYVLLNNSIPFKVVGRQAKSGVDLLYSELDADLMSSHRIIINTTPLGTFPLVEARPDLPYQWLTANHYLYDLVYNPAETSFLKEGKKVGATIKNGADMLVEQAEESWRIWNAM